MAKKPINIFDRKKSNPSLKPWSSSAFQPTRHQNDSKASLASSLRSIWTIDPSASMAMKSFTDLTISPKPIAIDRVPFIEVPQAFLLVDPKDPGKGGHEICVGSMIWINWQDDTQRLVCVREGHCGGLELDLKGHGHPGVICKIYVLGKSGGSTMCLIALISSFSETGLIAWARSKFRHAKLSFPIEHPPSPPTGGPILDLVHGSMKKQSYVQVGHLIFASLRQLRPFNIENFPLHAVRLSFGAYESLMEAFSIPKGIYGDHCKLCKDTNEKRGKFQTTAVRERIEMIQKYDRKQEEKRQHRLKGGKAIAKPANLNEDEELEYVDSSRLEECFRPSIGPSSSFRGEVSTSSPGHRNSTEVEDSGSIYDDNQNDFIPCDILPKVSAAAEEAITAAPIDRQRESSSSIELQLYLEMSESLSAPQENELRDLERKDSRPVLSPPSIETNRDASLASIAENPRSKYVLRNVRIHPPWSFFGPQQVFEMAALGFELVNPTLANTPSPFLIPSLIYYIGDFTEDKRLFPRTLVDVGFLPGQENYPMHWDTAEVDRVDLWTGELQDKDINKNRTMKGAAKEPEAYLEEAEAISWCPEIASEETEPATEKPKISSEEPKICSVERGVAWAEPEFYSQLREVAADFFLAQESLEGNIEESTSLAWRVRELDKVDGRIGGFSGEDTDCNRGKNKQVKSEGATAAFAKGMEATYEKVLHNHSLEADFNNIPSQELMQASTERKMSFENAPLDSFCNIFVFSNRSVRQNDDCPLSSHKISQKEVEDFQKYSEVTRLSIRFKEESNVWSESGRRPPKAYSIHDSPKSDYRDTLTRLNARKQRKAKQEANPELRELLQQEPLSTTTTTLKEDRNLQSLVKPKLQKTNDEIPESIEPDNYDIDPELFETELKPHKKAMPQVPEVSFDGVHPTSRELIGSHMPFASKCKYGFEKITLDHTIEEFSSEFHKFSPGIEDLAPGSAHILSVVAQNLIQIRASFKVEKILDPTARLSGNPVASKTCLPAIIIRRSNVKRVRRRRRNLEKPKVFIRKSELKRGRRPQQKSKQQAKKLLLFFSNSGAQMICWVIAERNCINAEVRRFHVEWNRKYLSATSLERIVLPDISQLLRDKKAILMDGLNASTEEIRVTIHDLIVSPFTALGELNINVLSYLKLQADEAVRNTRNALWEMLLFQFEGRITGRPDGFNDIAAYKSVVLGTFPIRTAAFKSTITASFGSSVDAKE